MALYLAYAEESDTVFCLFVCQETSEDPKNTQLTHSGSPSHWATNPI